MNYVLIAVVVIVILLIFLYNSLIKLKIRVDEAWSDITVQLKRRFDLIPNLVNSVKGYAKHEAETLEKIAKERSSVVNGGSIKETAAADNMLTGALKSVFAVAESNPDLKANQNFLQLQEELTDTEDKVQAARRFYNGSVRDLNTKIQTVPYNFFAGLFGFKTREFYEVDGAQSEAVKEPTKVNF